MLAYLLPILAVVLGALFVFFTKHKSRHYTKLLLSFSGAFLLAVTLLNLLPEVYHHLPPATVGICIIGGILLQIVLEFFSQGAEHGHIHLHDNTTVFPWLLFISLCIHSFMEGFPMHGHQSMVLGVFVHKIPIAILITTYLLKGHFKPSQIALFLIVFALMTPLGTLVSDTVSLSHKTLNSLNAVVIGIFFHISTTILFESNEGHSFNLSKLLAIVLGFAIGFLI